MTTTPEPSVVGEPAAATDAPAIPEAQDLERLRTLLLASEIETLKDLKARLDDPVQRAQELARVLPDAIAVRAAQDKRLGRALQATVDEALRVSVERDPKRLSDAIFPVLGPAIRKAISATLLSMVQSFNETVGQSLSLRGLRWRFQAWRSGRPYGEVVLLNTLVFRVEQVALLHREQGLVLAHTVAPDVAAQDSDLVFSMLSAIQSFMEDAFDESGSRLDTVRMGGDLSMWIEESRDLALALVVRGTPPATLRDSAVALLQAAQDSHAAKLQDFDGDTAPFATLTTDLESLLETRYKAHSDRIRPLTWLLLSALLGAGLLWPVAWFVSNQRELERLETFADALGATAGIVVTSAERAAGRYLVSGLRDPLSVDPLEIAQAHGVAPESLELTFESYHALNPELVLTRARARLTPPSSVTLSLEGETLVAAGTASAAWAGAAERTAAYLPGISALDTRALRVPERSTLQALVQDLEAIHLTAPQGQATLSADQAPALARAAELARQLEATQEQLASPVQILVLGFTDPTGEEDFNARLSVARAEHVVEQLAGAGVLEQMLIPVGRGVDATQQHNQGRYVAFRVLGPSVLRSTRP